MSGLNRFFRERKRILVKPRFFEAVLWRFRTGAPSRDIPASFGNGNSVFQGVQKGLFSVLSQDFDVYVGLVDGSILQAHAKAFGSNKGIIGRHWLLKEWFDAQDRRGWKANSFCCSA